MSLSENKNEQPNGIIEVEAPTGELEEVRTVTLTTEGGKHSGVAVVMLKKNVTWGEILTLTFGVVAALFGWGIQTHVAINRLEQRNEIVTKYRDEQLRDIQDSLKGNQTDLKELRREMREDRDKSDAELKEFIRASLVGLKRGEG